MPDETLLDQYRDVDELLLFGPLAHYCAALVHIRTKNQGVQPLVLNYEQLYVDRLLDAQRERTGRVRALVAKARKQGVSTYMAARFYRRATTFEGHRCYILAHEDKATANLYEMVLLMHQYMPADYRAHTGKLAGDGLDFDVLHSSYRLGTAKTTATGRSDTIQSFHGSEVAWWPNAEAHAAGVLETVPNDPGTEVVLETTGNGQSGYFFEQWKAAQAGESEFEPIFLPWFWAADKIDLSVPENFDPGDDWRKYARAYRLSDPQLWWAYRKSISLGGLPGKIHWQFRQEHPACEDDCFYGGGDESFISSEAVSAATSNQIEPTEGIPITIGVDCARGGKDRTRIIDRQGRRMGMNLNIVMHTDDGNEIFNRLVMEGRRLQQEKGVKVVAFVDVTSSGATVIDNARAHRIDWIKPINFGQSPIDSARFLNKRAEMWSHMKDWFNDSVGVQLVDDKVIRSHILAPQMGPGKTRYDMHSRLQIEDKASIKKRTKESPDGGDAGCLTFADTVQLELEKDPTPAWMNRFGSVDRYQPRGYMAR